MNAPVHFDPTEDAYSVPLDRIDVSDPRLYQDDIWYPYFERLRREDPVHSCQDGMHGSYWSVTKYKDIMHVETNHQTYSSEAMLGGITITDMPMEFRRAEFHLDGSAESRRAAQGGVADRGADESGKLSATIRERAGASSMGCRATRRSTGCNASRSN